MSPFAYRDGALHAEGVALAAIADAVGTPVYVYSTAALVASYRALAAALEGLPVEICYAAKANGNLAVIRTLVRQGAGVDVVSGGELRRALAAGCRPERIVFSGVGKTEEELRLALATGIHQVNVESLPELEALSAAAVEIGRTATVVFRVNPDVDARTHAKITTGRRENKFGIDIEDAPAAFARARELPGVEAVGLAVHLGSQLLDASPYRVAYTHLAELTRALRAAGHRIERLDLGGGFGIAYRDETPLPLGGYAAIVRDTVGDLGCRLTVEPGRSLAGDAGVLLARALFVKRGRSRDFLILDAAMNDLLRPALYDAWHGIVPVREPRPGAVPRPYDVVGPACESGDTFAVQRPLPPLAAGDLIAFTQAGAYGAAMASQYNARPLVPEVLVDGVAFAVVRKRPNFAETIAAETLPPWLA